VPITNTKAPIPSRHPTNYTDTLFITVTTDTYLTNFLTKIHPHFFIFFHFCFRNIDYSCVIRSTHSVTLNVFNGPCILNLYFTKRLASNAHLELFIQSILYSYVPFPILFIIILLPLQDLHFSINGGLLCKRSYLYKKTMLIYAVYIPTRQQFYLNRSK
jgi:hypothetical protein